MSTKNQINRKKSIIWVLLIVTLAMANKIYGQNNFAVNGYVKALTMYYHPTAAIPVSQNDSVNHLLLHQIHNRINFKVYAGTSLTFALEARNRLFFGQMVSKFPEYKESLEADHGIIDLSAVLASGDSWFLHTILDRAWADYTAGNWQVRVGRQRINWGINLVWNPNDVFNTFSYFDFDYEERPGTDAVKVQYYTGMTSSAELVYKAGEDVDNTAIAGMYRFSKWDYDIQMLGGWVGKDYLLGGGWAGDIQGGGFRGEVSWFLPRNSEVKSEEALVSSISGDYTLKNSLYLHTGILYNSNGVLGPAGGRNYFDQDVTAKMLSMGMFNLFGQVSYPITPLFSGNISGIINPSDGSFFIGPSLTYSLGNNLELLLNGQIFLGDEATEYGEFGQAVFGRLKWAF